MIDLNKLEQLAKAATPGLWTTGQGSHFGCEVRNYTQSTAFCGATNGLNDAAFIAAANPVIVLELIETIRLLTLVIKVNAENLDSGCSRRKISSNMWSAIRRGG